ncbi:MAG TPA: fumarylacetoacetate hydrolase family protein [Hyphomicrobiaceae bacterium]|nr:fumarylacetoacetate hydrolase family protein [Hyphomicrobiaceae bacterium]
MAQNYDPRVFSSRLLEARNRKLGFTPVATDLPPSTPDEAYAVQAEVMAQLGPAGAFKTGRTSPDGPQVMAPIDAYGVRLSPAVFTADEMRLVGIELEIAFRIDGPIPDPDAAGFRQALWRAVSVLPVLEVVDSRLADHKTPDAFAKLADNQFNTGLVLGGAVALTEEIELMSPAVDFHATSGVLGRGRAAVPGGNAFDTFADFVCMVGGHCGGLRAGQVVTTGALTGLHWIAKGETVRGTIEGLGSVEVRFEGRD